MTHFHPRVHALSKIFIANITYLDWNNESFFNIFSN